MSVKFQYGTQADYDSLENFDSTCIYFITDTHRVYRGDTLYASGIKDVRVNGESVKIEGIVDISVPTKTSDLTNDSNFVSDENYTHTDNNFTTDEKTKLGNLVNYDDTAIKNQIEGKQDKLTAGKDITIDENNVISLADDFIADVPFASSNQAGIIKIPIGCGIRQVGNDGSVTVDFPIEEITCQDKSINITKGTGSRNIEVNKSFIWGYVKDLAHKTEVEKKADKTYVDGELAKKQNNLTAGAGISINEDNVISASAHFQVEVVTLNEQGLPSVNEPSSQVLYLTHNTQTEVSDVYNEWLWIYDTEIGSFIWKKIGSTQVDLSGYAQKSELPTKTSDLTNDSNFVSDENYVHTDNNFTSLEKRKLSALANYDDTALQEKVAGKQDKLTAGENITIDENNVISATVQGTPVQGTTDYNKLENVPIKNLALSMTKNTMLTDIADGCYIVTEQGYIQTTGGRSIALDIGTELMINTYDGVKSGTYQTGKAVASFNDNLTASEKAFTWLNTSHMDSQITESATDSTIPTSKAVKDYVDNNSGHKFGHNYSTDEQVVGTWIDGKPVYERVLHYDTISQSGTVIMHYYDKDGNQITIPIERIINMNGFFVLNGAGQNPRSCEPIPRIQSSWSFTAGWFQEDKFMCTIDGNFNQFSGGISDVNITIRYTKTTDAIPQAVTE